MKKFWMSIAAAIASLAMIHCGGSDGGCPGMVCTSCGAFGDCDLDCTPPELNFCGAFGYFDDPGLRCSFCAPEDFQP